MAQKIDLDKLKEQLASGQGILNPALIQNRPCLGCGFPFYISVVRMGYMSALASPDGKERYLPSPSLICFRCGTEVGVDPKKKEVDDETENISKDTGPSSGGHENEGRDQDSD